MRYKHIRKYKTIARKAEKKFGKSKMSDKTKSMMFDRLLLYKRAIKKMLRNEELTQEEKNWVFVIAG